MFKVDGSRLITQIESPDLALGIQQYFEYARGYPSQTYHRLTAVKVGAVSDIDDLPHIDPDPLDLCPFHMDFYVSPEMAALWAESNEIMADSARAFGL